MKEIKKLKYNEPRKRTCLQFFLSVAVNELPSLNLLLKIFLHSNIIYPLSVWPAAPAN